MTTSTRAATTTDDTEVLKQALASTQADIARCDTKASMLLALAGAGLAVVGGVVKDFELPLAAQIIGGLGTIAIVGALYVLLLVVRPNTRGGHGWPLWATLTPEQLREQIREDHLVEQLHVFAVLAARKYSRIQIAVDLLRAGVALLVLATAVQIATAVL
ncbi:Pycsar system effector family protein [Streptomyces sp. Da 82-17]|uniref:Pycsar system effector family protein n=1 Tax=Streptomyces sp. Da 82-17 TaxID=3377116 RepID=UPI0038D3CEDF